MHRQNPVTDHRIVDAGFTIVELIAVMLITAIVAAVVAPRFVNKPSFDVRGFYDQAQAIVRYGQKLSVAQNVGIYVRLNGTSVALCYDAACASPVTAPSGSNSKSATTLAACGNNSAWYCEAVPSGVSYTAANGAGTSYVGANPAFYFSAQGKPYNTGDSEPNSLFLSPLSVTVTGDGANHVFIVEMETGYVHH